MDGYSYARRRYSGGSRKKLPPYAWVGIVLAVSILATVITGNLLKKKLSPEILDKLAEKETEAPAVENRAVYGKNIRAAAFSFGDSPASAADEDDLSLTLNRPDGKTLYRSPVSAEFGMEAEDAAASLSDTLGDLCATASYISGIYYPTAFSASDSDLFYAKTAKDCALAREFLRAGGSDILVVNLPSSSAELEDVKTFFAKMTQAAGTSPVGAALTPELVFGATGTLYLETLSSVCDFLALDLRAVPSEDLPKTLSSFRYYLSAYQMRVLSSEPVEADSFQIG